MTRINDLSRSHLRRLLVILALALSTVHLAACVHDANGDGGEGAETEEETVAAVPVEVADVVVSDVAAVYTGTASLEADRRATVVAKVTGVVTEVLAEEGQRVEEGQLLARIETDRYALEVQRTAAELQRLQTDFERKRDLFERQLVSAEEFERVRANLDVQKAAHGLARLDLRYTEIRAPIAGFIAERMVRVGNQVANGEATYAITSFDPLLAVLHVPERELPIIRDGLPVSIQVDAWPGEAFNGTVTRISPVVDPDTGTFRVTAEVDDPDMRLKPGLFGRVQVLYDTHESVPVVPRSALVTEDDQTHVFVLSDDTQVQRRNIRLGYESGQLVEVLEGLAPGDRVVTAGKGSLSDGAAVEIIVSPRDA